MEFKNKKQVVEKLVQKFGCKGSSFYNTPTNKSREKYWTYNRCLNYYCELKASK